MKLMEDVEIYLEYDPVSDWIVAEVHGTLMRGYAGTLETPNERPYIENMQVMVGNMDITEILPDKILDEIEHDVLEYHNLI